MLDYRIHTFLKLCELMNYKETAAALHITQPAVTQHIQFLEKEYNCKLFSYENRKLEKTRAGILLEEYARAMTYNETSIKQKLSTSGTTNLRIGATKSIGDYIIHDFVKEFLKKKENTLTLLVDNTEHLLKQIEDNTLDFAIIEGYFDKKKYGYHLFCREPFVGICHRNHPFAWREVELSELLQETIICREEGSGTRAILEYKLQDLNESIHHFQKIICISSFKGILELVKDDFGVSFTYEVIAESDSDVATFYIKNAPMIREFNYVYLKNTDARDKINLFLNPS